MCLFNMASSTATDLWLITSIIIWLIASTIDAISKSNAEYSSKNVYLDRPLKYMVLCVSMYY